jgi:hypothetical protein
MSFLVNSKPPQLVHVAKHSPSITQYLTADATFRRRLRQCMYHTQNNGEPALLSAINFSCLLIGLISRLLLMLFHAPAVIICIYITWPGR